ncbi:hypothetical protein QJS66_09980 [Kocuria rhizophila]|nr:hypothetical protein QJS66_09980 [Kocuria rhizophila]
MFERFTNRLPGGRAAQEEARSATTTSALSTCCWLDPRGQGVAAKALESMVHHPSAAPAGPGTSSARASRRPRSHPVHAARQEGAGDAARGPAAGNAPSTETPLDIHRVGRQGVASQVRAREGADPAKA